MIAKPCLPIAAALLSLGLSVPALAQDAAETATILSGTGQGTGSASRSMGSAVSGSINGAASQIRATQGGGNGGGGGRNSTARMGNYAIEASGDALEGTDAPSYTTGSGASIRVSGKLRQPAAATCTENCPADPAPVAPAP
jgi:hypothetical protein